MALPTRVPMPLDVEQKIDLLVKGHENMIDFLDRITRLDANFKRELAAKGLSDEIPADDDTVEVCKNQLRTLWLAHSVPVVKEASDYKGPLPPKGFDALKALVALYPEPETSEETKTTAKGKK